jgi:(p)ppGpp synthase/HD superfamily hydrolase
MTHYLLSSFSSERNKRLDSLRNEGAGSCESFLRTLISFFPKNKIALPRSAYDYAIKIEYSHVGLSSDAYLAHPLRVAQMAMSFIDPLSENDVIIAILHNIFEVSHVSRCQIEDRFGKIVADSIEKLTVVREKEWDQSYKQDYYDKLRCAYRGAAAVKVLDKLDNIFTLCLNEDEWVRNAYLDEIENFVVPLACEFLPGVASYLENAAVEARKLGYCSPSN